ncbi:MAG: hypothetical protein QGH94_12930 [Phycisphaerae bacterium]|jgi:hypothetical protein|nr:hypothetical protein [Phycisphaerae bacterium]
MEHANRKYFFPSESSNADLVFKKFDTTLAYLAGTNYNVFCDLFGPDAKPQHKETFRLFPVMTIYRLAIELLLKAIYWKVHQCQLPRERNMHDLFWLFGLICNDENVCRLLGDEKKFVKDALHELNEADPGSYAFRFGEEINGTVCFDGMPMSVNCAELFDTCDRLWIALWKVHGPVD